MGVFPIKPAIFTDSRKAIYGVGLRIEADPADPLRAYDRARMVDFG